MVVVFKQLQTLLNRAVAKLAAEAAARTPKMSTFNPRPATLIAPAVLPIDGRINAATVKSYKYVMDQSKDVRFAVFDQALDAHFLANGAGALVTSLANYLHIPVPAIALCPTGQELTSQGCMPSCPAGTTRTNSGCMYPGEVVPGVVTPAPTTTTAPTVRYPPGTITAYSAKLAKWRVAVPLSTAGFGAAAAFQEVAPTSTAPEGATPTTETDLEKKTGQLPFYKHPAFWVIAGTVLVGGAGVVVWRRRRAQ
jgi:phage baseplate assembly protein gpV